MRKPTAKTVIRKAYRLLTDPARWTKYTFARTEAGFGTLWESPYAVCFCMEGAIRRVTGRFGEWGVRHQALDYVRQAVGGDIPDFNDDEGTTHKMVLKKLREAYRLAGGSRP